MGNDKEDAENTRAEGGRRALMIMRTELIRWAMQVMQHRPIRIAHEDDAYGNAKK